MSLITDELSRELAVPAAQIEATIRLIDGGDTIPFIARYRKEVTGGLDDRQLRTLAERLIYLREREDRRATILQSLRDNGHLTPELERGVLAADTKTRLEDLYLPYKPKRRTKAQIAREAGLEPLAKALMADPTRQPMDEAVAFVAPDKGVADVKAALDGARQILIESFAEDADLAQKLRRHLAENGRIVTKVADGKTAEGHKFGDYFDFSEAVATIPGHRILAILRGRTDSVLHVTVSGDPAEADTATSAKAPNHCERMVAAHFSLVDQGRPADPWLLQCARWAWSVRLQPRLEGDIVAALRDRAEEEAVRIFAANLRELLLAAPAGPRAVIGLDPGVRTGVKVAAVSATGLLLETATVYPHAPKHDWDGALHQLAGMAQRHGIALIAIGNGTASRETDQLAADLLKRHPDLKLTKVMVSEAGASVYSASEAASEELPDIDVSLRGAVSIARRLQDPLAELVKIDPKSIGVGQYQHDVRGTRLARALDGTVEDCVNAVGVDLNTASVPLLARVSGLSETAARNIVGYRDQIGRFTCRQDLMKVSRLGPKTFEQAAGFLRIPGAANPLDNSAVHPEAYPLVEHILTQLGRDLAGLIGQTALLRALEPEDFASDGYGVPTVRDVLRELEKPGRDPRPAFRTATFRDDISEITHLSPGMRLEGVVTNVTAFGAFVDVGVHQDGLVHISQLADRFIKDPLAVVKPGDIVSVRVLEVDARRKRIGLSMRSDDAADRPAGPRRGAGGPARGAPRPDPAGPAPKSRVPTNNGTTRSTPPDGSSMTALAEAFRRAKSGR